MTRQQLETSIYAWLHRANFRSPVPNFDAVPSFIQLAEQDINLDVRARCMIVRASQPADEQYVPLPCDYLEAEDIRLSTGQELLYQPRQQVGAMQQRQYYPTLARDTPMLPTYYSVVGQQMEIWPFPTPNPDPNAPVVPPLTIEMAYYQTLALGPNPGDSNSVLSLYPGIYLYGSLLQSAPFLHDDERLNTWNQIYAATVIRANSSNERARTQGSRLVARFRRIG